MDVENEVTFNDKDFDDDELCHGEGQMTNNDSGNMITPQPTCADNGDSEGGAAEEGRISGAVLQRKRGGYNGYTPRVKPDSYTGEEDWESYLSHFQNCAALGHWPDEEKGLCLAACLRGQARTFYMGLSAAERTSYPMLVKRLTERFGSARQQSRWLMRLEARRRRPGEAMATVGDDIRRMAQRAYPDFSARAQEVIALNQLYKAIPVDLKFKCMDKECPTVTEAVDIIERYEAVLDDEKERKKLGINMVSDGGPKNSQIKPVGTEVAMQHILQEMQMINKGINQLVLREDNKRYGEATGKPQYARKSGSMRCFTCDSPDHIRRDCPLQQGQVYRKPAATYRPNTLNEKPSTL